MVRARARAPRCAALKRRSARVTASLRRFVYKTLHQASAKAAFTQYPSSAAAAFEQRASSTQAATPQQRVLHPSSTGAAF
eukprot:10798760-Lingulodinium_polyedra.AAC.1